MRDPTSRVSEFAKECSKDDFYIKPTIKGFCRDGTFSLTTAFNNGTLACGCDKQGAADQNCEELGGQCRCRSPYITGRTCNRCRMGYFGFPNCQGILIIFAARQNDTLVLLIRNQFFSDVCLLVCFQQVLHCPCDHR